MPAPFLAALPALAGAAPALLGGGGGGGGGGFMAQHAGRVAGPLALGTAIYQARADRDLQRRNKKMLQDLLDLERTGQLGLSGAEAQQITAAGMDPVARAAQAMAQRQDQMAAVGGLSPADAARLRQENTALLAQANQGVSQQLLGADLARQQQQRAEIEARQALKGQMRRDDAALIGGALEQMFAGLGAQAGAAPGTFSSMPQSEMSALRTWYQEDPEGFMRAYRARQAMQAGGAAPATGGPAAAAAATAATTTA